MNLKYLVSIVIIFLSVNFPIQAREILLDNKEYCEKQMGVWRAFGNDCADNCSAQYKTLPICASSAIFACDCGQDRCWYGGKCLALSDYSVIQEKRKELESKEDENNSSLASSVKETITKVFDPTKREKTKLELCKESGGHWVEFGSSCANKCKSKSSTETMICATIITFSCQCGQSMCWDGNKCIKE